MPQKRFSDTPFQTYIIKKPLTFMSGFINTLTLGGFDKYILSGLLNIETVSSLVNKREIFRKELNKTNKAISETQHKLTILNQDGYHGLVRQFPQDFKATESNNLQDVRTEFHNKILDLRLEFGYKRHVLNEVQSDINSQLTVSNLPALYIEKNY